MNEIERIVADIQSVFEGSDYPPDFLADYDQMECLANHTGRETFLVQRKSDGQIAVATCYNLGVFPLRPNLELLKSLSHPGLPRYYGHYQSEQMLCVVREYIEGESLSAYARDRQLTIAQIIDIALKLCDILRALHTHEPPVVHRDIKPENIIIRPDGGVALIDFDIARAVKEGSGTDTVFFGTKGYAPPEQYGFGQTDIRADIYAFGVLLRWLVTGSVRENQNITIDGDLQRIINRCTAFSPEERYGDIGQVERTLRSAGRHRQRLSPRTIATLTLAGLLLLVACFAVGRYTDWLRPVKKLTFQEPLIEQAARLWINKEKGPLTEKDLSQVTRLYIFGTQAFGDPELFYRCSIDNSTEGPIHTLDDLKQLPNLEEVHIVHQGYVDTAGVAGLANLYTVELKHMRLSGAAAIADAPSLRHAILFCDGLTDVTVLENCPWLKTLDIGLNDITSLARVGYHPNVRDLGFMWLEMDNVDDIAERLPKLQAITLQHSSIKDLSGLKELPNLEAVYVLQEQAEAVKALFEGTGVQINITEN